jgi:capsular exopolysaccharide synthesis family protein
MSQQVPLNDSGVPQGGNMFPGNGSVEVAPGGYVPQGVPAGAPGQYGDGGGYWQQQTYAQNKVPMIDPIESAKLTPQILVLLVLSGLKRHWKWGLPLGLVLGLLVAGICHMVFPLQHVARAAIQVREVKPQFLFNEQGRSTGVYDNYVNTQIALIRSQTVINMALEDAAVARLPIVSKQRDQKGWLAGKLRVRPEGKSEVLTISISTDSAEASETIVNTVVDAYFDFTKTLSQGEDQDKIRQLTVEKGRHTQAVQQYQETIRTLSKQTAEQGAVADGKGGLGGGFAPSESLLRDVYLNEAQLTALEAKRKMSLQRIERPGDIPTAVLQQFHPEFQQLNAQLDRLRIQRDEMKQYLKNTDDPRFKQLDQQINSVNARLGNIGNSANDEAFQGILKLMQLNEQMNQWNLEQDIQTMQLLGSELKEKYQQQLLLNADRSVSAAQIMFLQTNLERSNKVLDLIEEQLATISAEQRAPKRVTPLERASRALPNVWRQVAIIGGSGAAFLFLPLFLGIAVERMKPRLYHVSQVRRAVPQVLIGEIMEPPVSWVQGATFRKRLARYRESVHNWCTHLLLSGPFRSCKTLSVASVAGDDGKTFLAVQIAVAMAQMKEGNVLLIDGDMRVGRLHLLFGNEETGIGLADVLSFRNGLGEAVVQNEREPNLHLLSAGQLDVSPYELLGDGRFREMLDSLELSPTNPGGYSLIIVVLPPVANAAESLIMASSTDSTLLCVRQRETVLAAMEDVYRKLVNTGAAVDGIVVKDIPYYQMAGRDGGFADKLEQIRLSHLLQYAD